MSSLHAIHHPVSLTIPLAKAGSARCRYRCGYDDWSVDPASGIGYRRWTVMLAVFPQTASPPRERLAIVAHFLPRIGGNFLCFLERGRGEENVFTDRTEIRFELRGIVAHGLFRMDSAGPQ
jgi:hypothetical protein